MSTGKYGQDFGIVEEECFKYTAKDSPCMKTTCKRKYTRDYYYVGGFYGACNEPLMRMELVKNGPMAVSFQVYDDFMQYKVCSTRENYNYSICTLGHFSRGVRK